MRANYFKPNRNEKHKNEMLQKKSKSAKLKRLPVNATEDAKIIIGMTKSTFAAVESSKKLEIKLSSEEIYAGKFLRSTFSIL